MQFYVVRGFQARGVLLSRAALKLNFDFHNTMQSH